MNLSKKKALAAKTLNVGKNRIVFLESRISEIKEAITKQDIRDLNKEGAIIVKEVKGRKRNTNKKKRSVGNIRKKVNKRKQEYVKMTRKLRKHVAGLKKDKKVSAKEAEDIRKKIRNRTFRSKTHLKEHIGGLKK
ncbi:MAG: 50S ribosomal protein L19e [Nanoarchaeota archaeon]|nr:50S ribosomal protein L19e [Nanoarchaeota archaeon]